MNDKEWEKIQKFRENMERSGQKQDGRKPLLEEAMRLVRQSRTGQIPWTGPALQRAEALIARVLETL